MTVIDSSAISRKVTIGTAWLVAWRLVTRILGVVSTLVMARILTPQDFGILAMATTFAATIDSLSQVGVQEALIRRTEGDERLHDTAFTLQLGRAVLTGLGIAAGASAASVWFAEPRLQSILQVLAAVSAISGLRNIGVVAFRRDLDYRRQFIFLCIPRLLQVAVTIPLAVCLQSYWALVGGIVLSRVLEVGLSYAVHPYRPKLSVAHWTEIAGFSFWTWAASLASIVWNRCDPFVIGPVIGTASLGVYLIGAEIACLPVTELIAPAAEVLLGGFSLARRTSGSAGGGALSVATTLLFAIMPLMLAICGSSGFIVAALLGPEWSAASPLIAIAVWLGLFSPYSYVAGTALVSANRVRANFMANLIASVFKLAGLALTVTFTHDSRLIAAASVGIVGLEAGIFITCLIRAGETISKDIIGALGRLVISTSLVAACLYEFASPGQAVQMPVWQALVAGAAVGSGTVAEFVVLVYAVWLLAGRPQGPETRALGLLYPLLRSIVTKLRGGLLSMRENLAG